MNVSPQPEYSLPGVLHYLQVEWRRFERERNEWTIERAQMKARIALLEGERRGIEQLKLDLLKRVKMLEYALIQERKKYLAVTNKQQLQHLQENMDVDSPNARSPTFMTKQENKPDASTAKAKERSRHALKACLDEINYLTSMPTKFPLMPSLTTETSLPFTNNMSSTSTTSESTTSTAASDDEPMSSIRSASSTVDEEQQNIPANVDEVAMLNNNGNNNKRNSNNDEESNEMQEKYNLSEEKVQRMLKSARKGMRRKHLDSVRAVSFHPSEMLVASGSDDGTVKIWNLRRSIGKDGNPIRNVHDEADPIITYRGHNHIVTQVAISAEQNRVYSSSLDSTIRVWRLPSEGHSLYSPVGNMATYVGHTDAIWDFKLFPIARDDSCLLASASADGTVKLWDTQTSGQLLKSSLTFDGVLSENDSSRDLPIPTSLDFCHTDLAKMAVSFANAQIRIYDIETGQVITTLEGSNNTYDGTVGTQINKIIAHPTMPLIVSAHEDRQIKFYDLKSGKEDIIISNFTGSILFYSGTCAFSMSAHLDSVACLDIDPSGMTLVSGGHDSSIRLWDITMSKTCMQEFSAHRRKGHEGVLSVQYHKTLPWMVSGGADSIAKVYHHGHHH
ncbi:WD40-repeat-containing domain protein [Phascolomyces articulosus]|uniref:WD40-repeat-containing domain protein n=1 Tax=Phascolomyces articulosus TaxID=60185 RepID=A0AAD5KAJ9_9FUNG|nr:WD40-repeat-containing domain protein [Phascolomyces articulosus]